MKAYIISGCLAALAGILWALLNSGAQTKEFVGQELIAIAIAILGGTVMTGGYLKLPSIIAAAYFWTALDSIVQGANLEVFHDYQQHAANGLFALLFIIILLPLGKKLSGPTQTIDAEQKVEE